MTFQTASATGRTVTLCLMSVVALSAVADAADRSRAKAVYGTDPATGIVITPRSVPDVKLQVAVQVESNNDVEKADEPGKEGLPITTPHPKHTSEYRQIHRSIPFSRAEFDANPSYRHDAAMEILTGNARPQKTVVQLPAPAPPAAPYLLNLPVMRHCFDTTRGPYSRYQHLFGYLGGYRPKYYRY
jgi:hypothetical protein